MHELFKAKLREKAILVGMRHGRTSLELEHSLAELRFLVESAGAEVAGEVIQKSGRPRSSHVIGKGKLADLKAAVQENKANLVVFDDDLSPAQLRNLENDLETKVIDRSILILDIFARRARTNEAKTQVELAQMKYLYPRLTRRWSHLSKQDGGIGTKGPGETQLEVDRRLVDRRIKKLSAGLCRIDRERVEQRKRRQNTFKIALVGYTNAGKSTLFNLLTKAQVFADDRLFSTLDATTRVLYLPGEGRVLLTDTIGFIRKLPVSLLASFRATLAEIGEADLLVHVLDCAQDDFNRARETVDKTLNEIDSGSLDQLVVYNKIDLLDGSHPSGFFAEEGTDTVAVSAREQIGIPALLERLGFYCNRWKSRRLASAQPLVRG